MEDQATLQSQSILINSKEPKALIPIVMSMHQIMLTSRMTKGIKEREYKEFNEVLYKYICFEHHRITSTNKRELQTMSHKSIS